MSPDWILSRITDHVIGTYRYTVEGRNLNYPEDHPMHRFSWRIPANSLDDPRYDKTMAEMITNHRAEV